MHFDTLQGWLGWQETLHPKSIDLGLTRVLEVYKRMPCVAKKPVTITVAGTNGKGSCIAFLEAIYRAADYSVGSYTSPHIVRYNERIKINGIAVSDAHICASFERIEAARENVSLSYFEFNTLAALDIFARAGVDIQLLEVGLGGRLDAVNIIDADATLISSISIDHTAWLGNTRDSIGYEKAGIFRTGVNAIIGDPEPPQSLLEHAHKIQAPLLRIGHEFNYQKKATDWALSIKDKQFPALPFPALKGEHQYRNAATALTAAHTLQDKLAVTDNALSLGISQAKLAGRLQLIKGQPAVLLEVGHNPQAALALAEHLQSEFKATPIHAVFTMMNDKDLGTVIELMQARVKHWYISPLDNPRTSSESDIQQAFKDQQIDTISTGFKDFTSTFQAAKNQAETDDGLVLIFGSFFLVAEYLSLFGTHTTGAQVSKQPSTTPEKPQSRTQGK
ncbi:MAG: bifunctional tetrahydrofolate synthase/dihydrofolate synthase [Methyloprofundus sp.]|nr:bifunctional tetrahydrofolate synthase/dihydrofolate synthase [Methyloprofundus sp.]